MLTKENYKPRIIDDKIGKYLKIFGAISLEGPKWCGKTWTALNHANSVFYLNDPTNGYQNRRYAQMDAEIILDKEAPELLDEWQEVPELWDAVRYKCDQDSKTGKYILTGSATPVSGHFSHSGAGRICRLNMFTMSLYESGDSSGIVSLTELFKAPKFFRSKTTKKATIKDLAYYIVRGGWPANIGKSPEDAGIIPTSYLNDVLLHDISSIDGVARNQTKMEMLLRSLARNESTISTSRKLMRDIDEVPTTLSSRTIGKNTVTDYLDVLNRLFIIDNIPAYNQNLRSSEKIGVTSKRHFTDVSLAAAALGLTRDMILSDLNTFGLLFESLCERDLQIYVDNLGGKIYHYRNNSNGLEIDTIVELPNGEYGAIEIKLGTDTEEFAAKNLLKFNESIEKKPTFLAIVNGIGDMIFRRPDGVFVIPITALKP